MLLPDESRCDLSDLATLKSAILSIPAETTPEQLLELRDRVDAAKQFTKELDKLVNDRLAEYIEAHGAFECGGMLWTFSQDKDVNPKLKSAELAERIMQIVGGDWTRFGDLLASGAFKHGAVGKACDEFGMRDTFNDLFETVYKQTVEGKPVKSVKKIPAHMVK